MKLKLIIGLSIIFAGTLGFLIGSKLTASKLKEKQKVMESKYASDLNKLRKELKDSKKVFDEVKVSGIVEEKQKVWNQISEDLKNPKKDSEPKDLDMNFTRDEDEITTYNHYMDPVVKYDAANPTKDIVRVEATNGIVEIEEWEYRETKGEMPSEDLQYHEMSTDLYFDNEEMIDPGDIPLYVGYNQEELAVRFLHDDEPDRIIIKNPDHGKFYIVYLHEGVV